MDITEKKQYLAQIDLFHCFSEDELEQFATNVSEVKLNSDEVIFRENDPGLEMYILLAGVIKIYKDNRFITQIQAIDYLGEMAIIENKPRSATAIAGSSVTLLKISAALFQDYLAKQPRSLVSMMKTLSSRIRFDTCLIADEYQRANILIHDMRNRLSAFLLLNIFETKELPEKKQRYVEIMLKSCQDLAIMMDEALANAKHLKFDQLQIKSSINNLIIDLQSSEFALHPSLHDKKIILQLADNITDFTFCEIEIRRVLTNLVINAGQASAKNGAIFITSLDHQTSVEISVRDNGKGIARDIQKMIFKPHFTTKTDGNGLGLASCQEIIEAKHRGTINFSSTSKGTTFRITLPKNRENITPCGRV